MSREEINNCPIKKWEGAIQLVRSEGEAADAIQQLNRESVLGFDTETRPAFTKGKKYLPSLLQLAGAETIYLFQLRGIGLAKTVVDLLSNPNIIKAGVSLAFDLRELRQIDEFSPQGFVDLGRMAQEKGIQNQGLRGLAAVVLGFRISKSAQTSNWAKEELTMAQVRYAATDAWVGRELYLRLSEM